MAKRTWFTLLALLAVSACSHDVTSPHGGVFAVAIAGAGQRDTIDAYLSQPLVLEVTGTRTIANRLLSVHSITYDTSLAHPPCYILFTIPNSDADQLTCGTVQPTNSNGQLTVSVHFAGVATTQGGLVVTVLDSAGGAPAGSPDTIHFTIEPGNAIGLTASPKDSSMYVGGAGLALHAFVHDRGNNPRSDAVTYTSLTGPITLSGSQVSASTFGRAAIMVNSGSYVDTTYLSIVPNGTFTFASPNFNGIAILGLDGSNYHLLPLPSSSAAGTTWAPNGASIAFEDDALALHRISIIDTTGNTHIADTTALDATAFEYQARYSRDGQWLYFTRLSMTGHTYSQLWRVGTNATAATRVPSNDPEFDYNPAPSPDGSTLVYAGAPEGAQSTIRLVNVTTGAVTNTGVTGDAPRWSPQGQTIAFLNTPAFEPAGPLTVMQSDGSNIRSLTPNGFYQYDIDWSPDGQWLIAINAITGNIDVVNVTSGLTLPLAFTRFAVSVSWRQTPH
jgi:hypothetical protein